MEYLINVLLVFSLILNVIAQPEVEIIGGKDAERGAYAFVVAILIDPDEAVVHCAGAIYNSFHVITAAQCLYGLGNDTLWIRAGITKLTQNDSQSFVSESENYTYHRNYYGLYNSYEYDIGVIKLKTELPLAANAYLASIQLPKYRHTFVGQTAVVLGWGLFRTRPPTFSNALKFGKVGVVNQERCRQIYRNYTSHPSIGYSHLCAYANGTDHCNGDAGAPLALKVGGNWTLIGLASWGKGCAQPGIPGVYANTAILSYWVVGVIGYS